MNRIDLSGQWRFALDPQGVGTNFCGGWYQRDLPDTVTLPGDILSNKKGIQNLVNDWDSAGVPFSYVGPGWYQRDIEIPQEWAGKSIYLDMERTARTTVWVDEIPMGSDDKIQVRQQYALGNAAHPGKHRLTVCVDNSARRPLNYGRRSVNGMYGKIQLIARDKVHVDRILITPLPEINRARFEIFVVNASGIPVQGKLYINTTCRDGKHSVRPKAVDFLVEGTEKKIWFEQYMGEDFAPWDEFTPTLYDVLVKLVAKNGVGSYVDEDSASFGMRSFTQKEMQFYNSGKAVFLRGDCAGIAKRSYNDHMDLYNVDFWRGVMEDYKNYGINHLRFHTHCPPEACLYAADEYGMYIQMELPVMGYIPFPEELEFDPMLESTLIRQGKNVLKAYANHPSFVLFSLGNEIEGDYKMLGRVVEALRAYDPSRLYAQGTNNNLNDPFPLDTDDFFISNKTAAGHGMIRGSCAYADYPVGKVQNEDAPDSYRGFSEYMDGYTVPMMGHELGQYETSPNFDDIDDFSSEWKPRNLLMFKELMEKKGLLYKEKDFFAATGQLSVLCYREDMEMAYRTPGLCGFQLLALNDCLGQGSSLVGMRNAVGRSKGIVTPQRWRCWCSDRVVLIGLKKYVYTIGENVEFEVKLCNFGPDAVTAPMAVTVSRDGETVLETTLAGCAPQGARAVYGMGCYTPDKAGKYVIRAQVEGTDVYNEYSIWAFPAAKAVSAPNVITRLDDCAKARLEKGESLVLIPENISPEYSVEGHFASNFWSYAMFANMSLERGVEVMPGTLGLCIDTASPALGSFPTDTGTDWQWWNLVMGSRPVFLGGLDKAIEPTVWMVDNPMRCEKMGLVFEMKVGAGKLLVSSIALTDMAPRHPEAACLLENLVAYAASDAFQPKGEATLTQLEEIFG